MQLLNKTAIKNTFAHTWYLYPISIGIISAIWVWSFYAFHLPSAHQKIEIFFSTEVRSNAFLTSIMNKHYEKEKLREVSHNYSLPSGVAYYQKLQLALSSSDILVLDEGTLSGFANQYQDTFVEINDYIKINYLTSEHTYYNFDEKNYGILIKEKNAQSYLSNYMTFDETQDYYLVLNQASTNLGSVLDEGNADFDNALTFMDYLLEGNI